MQEYYSLSFALMMRYLSYLINYFATFVMYKLFCLKWLSFCRFLALYINFIQIITMSTIKSLPTSKSTMWFCNNNTFFFIKFFSKYYITIYIIYIIVILTIIILLNISWFNIKLMPLCIFVHFCAFLCTKSCWW